MTFPRISKVQIFIYIAISSIAFALGYYVASTKYKASDNHFSVSDEDTDHLFGKVNTMGKMESVHDSNESTAKSLGDLVAGLEKKVAANPENIDQQLLLAQTYNELEQREKSLNLLKKLNNQSAKNAQVKIVYATILMKSENSQDLKLAYQLFEDAIKLKPDVDSMAKMYMGEINVKLKR